MPNFNFKSQFPIADVIAAAQKKPQIEAQMEQEKEAMRQARFKTLLDALSTGAQASRLMSQNQTDALARKKTETQAAGQQDLQNILSEPPPTAPVAAPIQQFQRPAGPVSAEGVAPAPVPAATVQPTFAQTDQASDQPQRLQAALIKGFPDAAGKQFAEQQFADPLDRKYKQAQIDNIGVDNQAAAAQLLEQKRKDDFGISNDQAKLDIDRQKLAIEREKLKNEGGGKLTDAQANALLFGERAAQSDKQLADLVSGQIDPKTGQPVPGSQLNPTSPGTTFQRWLPNRMQSDKVQLLEQSKINFVSAVLRKESGSAISKDEWAYANRQYFPVDGDSAKVLQQKQQNRLTAIGGLLRQGGKDGQAIMSKYRLSSDQSAAGTDPALDAELAKRGL